MHAQVLTNSEIYLKLVRDKFILVAITNYETMSLILSISIWDPNYVRGRAMTLTGKKENQKQSKKSGLIIILILLVHQFISLP